MNSNIPSREEFLAAAEQAARMNVQSGVPKNQLFLALRATYKGFLSDKDLKAIVNKVCESDD